MKSFAKTLFGFFLLIIALLNYSCKKEFSNVGENLQPSEEFLKVVFESSNGLVAYAKKDSATKTANITQVAIGSLKDPVFGLTSNGLLQQFNSKSKINFGDSPILDSIVLTLQYKYANAVTGEARDKTAGYYGDTTSTIGFQAFRLAEKLNDTILSNVDPVKAEALSEIIYLKPKPNDSVSIANIGKPGESYRVAPHIRIRLNDNFGNEIINAAKDGLIDENSEFQKWLKGIYIESKGIQGGVGVLPIINLGSNNTYTRLELFYHDSDDSSPTMKNYIFDSKDADRRAFYSHDYTVSTDQTFVDQIVGGNKEEGVKKIYIQGNSGVRSIINFDGLADWSDKIEGKLAINKAELIIPVDFAEADKDKFDPVNKLTLIYNIKGNNLTPPRDAFLGGDYYGGTYDSDTKEYRFRLNHYIQGWLNDKTDVNKDTGVEFRYRDGLAILSSDLTKDPSRSVINGINSIDPDRNLRLEITYTIIK